MLMTATLSVSDSYSQQWLEYLERIIPPTIGDYQLQANTGKWERTTIASKESPVSDPSIQSLGRVGAWTRGANEWKSTRKLGSFLGDEEDVQRRIQLATVQFKALDKLWKQSHSVPVETRLRLYKALVLPVLTYNAGTWGITQQVAGRLDAFHRKQLREVVRVKWPMRISNEALYEQCSSTRISLLVDRARWSLFGHVLRLHAETPAQLAMDFYCQGLEEGEGKVVRGRAITTLPVVLFNEYHAFKQAEKALITSTNGTGGEGGVGQKTRVAGKESKYRQKPHVALKELRKLAQKRDEWRVLVRKIVKL